jgi:cytochrome c biogenesis protein CcmG, thiol:disulfide interchange protein DsbE
MRVERGSTHRAEPAAPVAPAGPVRRGVRWVRWAALAAAGLAVVMAGVLGFRLGSDPTLVQPPLLGRPAPAERLPYLERPGALSLADLRGKVVVVNFWASWCSACRAEHPDLLAAAAAFRDAGVQFVGVVYQDQPRDATAMLDELGRGQGYQYVIDPESTAAADFGVFGIPETFFIDRRGVVVAKITGKSNLAVLTETLTQLLAGRTPPSRKTGQVQATQS